MDKLLKLENLAVFIFTIYLFSLLELDWWWFPLTLLLPDIGMIGYVVNAKVGAFTYNLAHHQGAALIVYLLGVYTGSTVFLLVGIIMIAHSNIDRVLGFGLKYTKGFKHTHLGEL